MQWIKLSTDIFNNRKIKQIQSIPNGDTIFAIWIRMLIMAAETNDNGKIYITKDKPYGRKQFSTAIGKPVAVVEEAMKIFKEYGMISIDSGIIIIKNWKKYQSAKGTGTAKKETSKKESRTLEEVIRDSNLSPNMEKTVRDFIAMRERKRAPMTDVALELMLKNLDKMTNDEQKKIDIMNQSIENGWSGVFELDRRKNGKRVNDVPQSTKEDEAALDFVFGRASS